MKIITVTANPCVDKSTTAPYLRPEKKLRCERPLFEPGGGGINVCRAIVKLGGKAIPIYPSGGHTGQFLDELIRKEQLEPVTVPTNSITRENFIVVDKSSNNQYRFGMPGPELSDDETDQLLKTIEDASNEGFIVASGSLTPGMDDDFFARIAAIARKKQAKLVLDTSGEALKLALKERIYLCKPNIGELASLAGKEELTQEEAIASAKEIIAAGNCEMMVISMGAAGAALVTKDEQLLFSAPVVKRRSTVGAGDSMLAGIVLKLSQGASAEDAARYGVACGTAATMNPGTELCKKADADRLYAQVHVKPAR